MRFAVGEKLKTVMLIVFVAASVIACSKEEQTGFSAKAQTYKMFTDSTSSVLAGGFTITELSDKNARLTLTLNQANRTTGETLTAKIVAKDTAGIEFVYSRLANVDLSTGISETAKLITDSSKNIKFADIITSKGYKVKVLKGNKLHAVGSIN